MSAKSRCTIWRIYSDNDNTMYEVKTLEQMMERALTMDMPEKEGEGGGKSKKKRVRRRKRIKMKMMMEKVSLEQYFY